MADHGSSTERVYIALGSNLGDRHAHLARGRQAIAEIPGCRLLAESSVEETTPLGGVDQPPYLNQMVVVDCELPPDALLVELQRIERTEGRERRERWAPRTLDLDIVCIEGRTVSENHLTVPHPGLEERDFWRRELAELRSVV